jgi:uncharacterized alkaline shock family protein YloU
MHEEESRTDLGLIRIHKNVIVSIAALAASEIEGVQSIGGGIGTGILEALTNRKYPSIKVEILRNDEVRIRIPLVIKFGYSIPDVACRVQENVRAGLEKMTNLLIKDINIVVQAIERGKG